MRDRHPISNVYGATASQTDKILSFSVVAFELEQLKNEKRRGGMEEHLEASFSRMML